MTTLTKTKWRDPTDYRPRPGRFSSKTKIFVGRRGQGKTLLMTVEGGAIRAMNEKHGAAVKIISNYSTAFSHYHSQYLIDNLVTFPEYAQDALLLIDEIQTAALSRRSMSKEAVNLSGFMTMIRKRRVEVMFTTQFPQTLDQQLLMQIDLV